LRQRKCSLYRQTASYKTYCEGAKNSNERKKERKKERKQEASKDSKKKKKTQALTARDGAQKFVAVHVTTSYGGAES